MLGRIRILDTSQTGPRYPCTPHPAFFPRTSWPEGPGSVARALRYYLDRTSDLRQKNELVFVCFKKGCKKDISPALSPQGSSRL